MSDTIHKVTLNHPSAIALLRAHQLGLLSGDGAMERLKLYEAIVEPASKHEKEGLPPDTFSLSLDVTSNTIKAWLSGAANSIMRHAPVKTASGDTVPMDDTHVEVIIKAAKALGFVKELKKKVPPFNVGDALLERDDEEAELIPDEPTVPDSSTDSTGTN